MRERGTLCCFDPAWQVGYPKTPVFDSGSRPAEFFVYMAGGGYRPDVYKMGLALCCITAPLFLAMAAWGIGINRAGALLAVALEAESIKWGCRQRARGSQSQTGGL